MPPVQALVDLVREVARPGMRVAEIGCFDGSTAVHYLPTVRDNGGTCYLVDWFRGEPGLGVLRSDKAPHGYCDDPEPLYEALKANVAAFPCVTILKGLSVEMADLIPDHSLDLCFIDADHGYEAVGRDIDAYLGKVKPGGVLCGHDCDGWRLRGKLNREQLMSYYLAAEGCHPGVVQAVYDRFGDDVEVRPDPGVHKIPIWVKRLSGTVPFV